MTTRESSAGSGPSRGRGLDALFESSPAPSSSVPGIDAELAAMLEREVRAGAPPIESIESISLPAETVTRDAEAAAGAVVSAERGTPFPTRGAISADGGVVLGEDEAIDLPSPTADLPSIQTPSPAAPTPAIPVVGSTPSLPPLTAPPPPQMPGGTVTTPVSVEQPLPPPVRIGAVIIDGSPTGAVGATSEVGPAGELLVTEQTSLPTIIVPGERDVLPPGPGVRPPSQPVPVPQPLAEDQKTIIISRLNEVRDIGWQRALHQQIDELYKQVTTEFSSPPGNADHMLTQLQEARQILLESPENYVAAEYRIAQVRSTMSRTRESRLQSTHLAPRVFVYELVWLALLLLGLVFAASLAEMFTRAGNITGATASDLFPFWNTLMWGGIGGIIGALYALWWHVSDQQDFDRQYLMWYLVQPIMGVVLGGIVFLLLTGGFLILQIKPSDPNAGARLLPYLVAVLAGFRQNFIYNQLDRLIGLFAPSGNQSSGGQG
jgi:hypothetical protein